MFILSNVGAFSVMKVELSNQLLAFTHEQNCWTTKLSVYHNGKMVDISSAAHGKLSTTPVGAPDQPTHYPFKSKYRFDTKYKGLESFPDLFSTLSKYQCCPGCNISITQTPHNSRTSSVRLGNWTIACSHNRVANNVDSKFVDGSMKMSGTLAHTIKQKKTKGSTYIGVDGMMSKTSRKKLKKNNESQNLDAITTDKGSKSRRSIYVRSARDERSRCQMKLIIFLNRSDNFFYLSTTSDLNHTGHPYIPPNAICRSEKDIDADDKELLRMMYTHNAGKHLICKILERHGNDSGTFLPKTIYNMNENSKKMIDLTNGITSSMSDAEKTLRNSQM